MFPTPPRPENYEIMVRVRVGLSIAVELALRKGMETWVV